MRRGVWFALFALTAVLTTGALGCDDGAPPPGTMEPLGPPSGAKPAPAEPAKPDPPAPVAQPEPEPPKPPPEGSVQLRWKLPKAKRLGYRASYATKPGPAPAKLDPAAIIKAGGLSKPLAAKLAAMGPPGGEAVTALLTPTYGSSMRIRMINKEFDIPPEMANDLARQLVDANMGIQLKGELSGRGVVQSASSGSDYAVLGLMFDLPEAHVLLGDTWESPVDLLRGGDMEVEKTEQLNKVTLKALKPLPGGEKVAVIEIAMAVIEEGKRYTAEGEEPAKRWAVAIGRGEMLLKAGRWKKFSGIIQTDDPAAKPPKSHTILKLAHLPQIPAKFSSLD